MFKERARQGSIEHPLSSDRSRDVVNLGKNNVSVSASFGVFEYCILEKVLDFWSRDFQAAPVKPTDWKFNSTTDPVDPERETRGNTALDQKTYKWNRCPSASSEAHYANL